MEWNGNKPRRKHVGIMKLKLGAWWLGSCYAGKCRVIRGFFWCGFLFFFFSSSSFFLLALWMPLSVDRSCVELVRLIGGVRAWMLLWDGLRRCSACCMDACVAFNVHFVFVEKFPQNRLGCSESSSVL